MRASQRVMMRRRRRTFLAAAVLTVVGVVAAERTGDAQPTAEAAPLVAVDPSAVLAAERDDQVLRDRVAAAAKLNCARRARVCVDLTEKIAWLQRDGRITYGPVPIGHGKVDKPTPVGSFRVEWKAAEYTSRTYGIPMPYSVFFAGDGIAFHQGKLDEPSHGCVHLPRAAARTFFHALDPGDRVVVKA